MPLGCIKLHSMANFQQSYYRSFLDENYLERSFKVSVGRFLCHSRCELVFFFASRFDSFSILRVYSDVARVFGNSRFYPFCIIFSLSLFWLHQKVEIECGLTSSSPDPLAVGDIISNVSLNNA